MEKIYYYDNYKTEITLDDWAESPRDWDNLGTMLTWQRGYSSPDTNEFATPDDFIEWWNENCGVNGIILPVYCLEHGNISYSTSNYGDKWDSGQVGFIYVTSEDFAKEGVMLADAIKILENEVKIYSYYANGEVYSINTSIKVVCDSCKHVEWEYVDGCGGYYGGFDLEDLPEAIREEAQKDFNITSRGVGV